MSVGGDRHARKPPPRKPRGRSEAALAAARALLEDRGIAEPDEIDIEALAASCGVDVLWGALDNEEGHLVHRGDRGVARIAWHARRSAKWRFVLAHELGHFLLHRGVDQFARCTTGDRPEGGTPWRLESEANDFATELLLPWSMVHGRCLLGGERAIGFDRVRAIARDHGTSLSSTALRVAELSDGGCAVAFVVGDRVVWKRESVAFGARIVKKKPLPAWAETGLDGVAEESMPMGEGARLVWVSHSSRAG
jgi:hypothetical protein